MEEGKMSAAGTIEMEFQTDGATEHQNHVASKLGLSLTYGRARLATTDCYQSELKPITVRGVLHF